MRGRNSPDAVKLIGRKTEAFTVPAGRDPRPGSSSGLYSSESPQHSQYMPHQPHPLWQLTGGPHMTPISTLLLPPSHPHLARLTLELVTTEKLRVPARRPTWQSFWCALEAPFSSPSAHCRLCRRLSLGCHTPAYFVRADVCNRCSVALAAPSVPGISQLSFPVVLTHSPLPT